MDFLRILFFVFALFSLIGVLLQRRKRAISLFDTLFWGTIWVGIILVSLYPIALTYLAKQTQIGRAIDILVYSSIIVLFYIIFRLYVKLEKAQSEITRLVRSVALDHPTISDVKNKSYHKDHNQPVKK